MFVKTFTSGCGDSVVKLNYKEIRDIASACYYASTLDTPQKARYTALSTQFSRLQVLAKEGCLDFEAMGMMKEGGPTR